MQTSSLSTVAKSWEATHLLQLEFSILSLRWTSRRSYMCQALGELLLVLWEFREIPGHWDHCPSKPGAPSHFSCFYTNSVQQSDSFKAREAREALQPGHPQCVSDRTGWAPAREVVALKSCRVVLKESFVGYITWVGSCFLLCVEIPHSKLSWS